MSEVKVLMVGPKDAGKTALANYIADAVQNADNPRIATPKPTVGARVLEFDRQIQKGNTQVNVSVEIWDVSGDRAYEGAWPAIQHSALGAIFVYDGELAGEDKELDFWHKRFAEPLGLKEAQCLVFAHFKKTGVKFKHPSAKSVSKIHCVGTTLEENQESIKNEFDKFLSHVVTAAHEKREKEEQSLLS